MRLSFPDAANSGSLGGPITQTERNWDPRTPQFHFNCIFSFQARHFLICVICHKLLHITGYSNYLAWEAAERPCLDAPIIHFIFVLIGRCKLKFNGKAINIWDPHARRDACQKLEVLANTQTFYFYFGFRWRQRPTEVRTHSSWQWRCRF